MKRETIWDWKSDGSQVYLHDVEGVVLTGNMDKETALSIIKLIRLAQDVEAMPEAESIIGLAYRIAEFKSRASSIISDMKGLT